MQNNIRIIPRLDIKGPNLVKGVHLEGLRVLGRPVDFAKYYYENNADELIYIDTVASLYNRNSLHRFIEETAEKVFIPLTVGGGLRTIEDIRAVLRCGADKVALNTEAIKNPQIIKEASKVFGASTIVITIEAIKESDGRYLAFTNNGREFTGVEVLGWARKVEELGAGEILLTSVDRDGTGFGFDIELTRMISNAVSIPVIASGGAGKKEHIRKVIEDGNADAVAMASILHYDAIKILLDGSDRRCTDEGNIEFLKSKKEFSKVQPAGLNEIKEYLAGSGIKSRFNKMENAI
ncbi:MAG: imidazole glycerol phosphate synthase cyclase subunit [bacterium]